MGEKEFQRITVLSDMISDMAFNLSITDIDKRTPEWYKYYEIYKILGESIKRIMKEEEEECSET